MIFKSNVVGLFWNEMLDEDCIKPVVRISLQAHAEQFKSLAHSLGQSHMYLPRLPIGVHAKLFLHGLFTQGLTLKNYELL